MQGGHCCLIHQSCLLLLQLHDIQFGPVKQSSVVDTTPITLFKQQFQLYFNIKKENFPKIAGLMQAFFQKKKNDLLLTRCKTLGLRHFSVVQSIYKVESIVTNISFSALGLFSLMLQYEKYVPWQKITSAQFFGHIFM